MRQSLSNTLALLKQDFASRCRYENKQVTFLSTLRMLFEPGVLSIVLFRFQVFFYTHYLKPLAVLLEYINLVLFAVSIDSRAKIGGGLILIHANAIFISQHVVIGNDCILFHQNSIGFSPFFEAEREAARDFQGENRLLAPLIGNNVIVGAGASIYGPIVVGDHCKVAVNSALDSSCAEGSVMFGVPARQVAKK
ncbi:MAG: hypothetical protein R8K20_04830 [Gallionellaceae bacterium]